MFRKKFDKDVLKEVWEDLKEICDDLNQKTEFTEEDKKTIAKRTNIVLDRYEELVMDEEIFAMLQDIIPLVDTDSRAEKLSMYLEQFC